MKKLIILCVLAFASTLFSGCCDLEQHVRSDTTEEYKVFDIDRDTVSVTNNFGGVMSYKTVWSFSYIDGDNVRDVSNFENLPYGLTKVKIGDEDKYVVSDNGFDSYRTLFLTEETYERMENNE